MPTRRIRSACCARTASGQVSEDAVVLPSSVMNSRRLIASPRGLGLGIVSGRTSYVRFGSKADMCGAKSHVRFTPESGHKTAVCDLSNLMSALLSKMSALTLKADMCGATCDVR